LSAGKEDQGRVVFIEDAFVCIDVWINVVLEFSHYYFSRKKQRDVYQLVLIKYRVPRILIEDEKKDEDSFRVVDVDADFEGNG